MLINRHIIKTLANFSLNSISSLPQIFPNDSIINNYLTNSYNRYKTLEKSENPTLTEQKEMQKLSNIYLNVSTIMDKISYNQELIQAMNLEQSPDIIDMINSEVSLTTQSIEKSRNNLINLIHEKTTPRYDSVIVEVVPGVGGTESAIFGNELVSLYTILAEEHGMTWRELDTEINGGNTIKIIGDQSFPLFEYESGVHRVQRVPKTERSGRVHTSTVAVCVRPDYGNVEVTLDEKDLEIQSFRASGHGGQHVNKSNTAVRIRHVPSGIYVENQEERCLNSNIKKAMNNLRKRLESIKRGEQNTEIELHRSTYLASRERSLKIRTYNQPQDRVTDHRIAHTLFGYQDYFSRSDKLVQFAELLNQHGRTARIHDYIKNI